MLAVQRNLSWQIAPLFVVINVSPSYLSRRRPINVVVGAPIPVPKVECPTDEEVDRVHATYVAALTKLYQDNVAEYGDPAQKLVIE